MTDSDTCALCLPSPHHEILWQDNFCRVVLLNDIDYPAYCRVELVDHVAEMTDLTPDDRARTMDVVFAVEAALREVINPDKINLACFGNKTPHVHWHVIPRFEEDKHFPNSYWGEATKNGKPYEITALELATLKEKIHRQAIFALHGQGR